MDDAQKNAIDSAVVDTLGEDKDMIGLFLAELAMNGDAHYNKLKLLTSMPQAIKAYAQRVVSLAAPAAADGKGKGYPPPTKKDQEMIIDLVEANDIEGLRKAAMDGYDLNVIGERQDGYYYVLHQAIWKGNFEMMKLVLETGVSVFSITLAFPKTALQVAAKCGHRDICELLIKNGLDPHEKDTMTSDGSGRSIESWSAVKYAKENNHPELAQWLQEQPKK